MVIGEATRNRGLLEPLADRNGINGRRTAFRRGQPARLDLPRDEAAAATVRSLLGEQTSVATADEIASAFRKTLEHAAADLPLVVVFDDIHWGEATLLDLIEHVGLPSSGPAILIVAWRGGSWSSGALPADDAAAGAAE